MNLVTRLQPDARRALCYENRLETEWNAFLTSGFRLSTRFSPDILTRDEAQWLRVSLPYRLQYYTDTPRVETLPAWEGACWCADESLGGFQYGPGPDDPSMKSGLIAEFFKFHQAEIGRIKPVGRRLDRHAEEELNRQCLVLGLFELILHRGLDESRLSPLFSPGLRSLDDLLLIPEPHLIAEATRLSYLYYGETRVYDDAFGEAWSVSARRQGVRRAGLSTQTAARLKIVNFNN
ncbi:MAG: hypothetical protein GC154_04890 [bacterium]|nr:hypothetical protein [bacterium]